ncbi:MAG TPA: DUF432 domain-containing protein, partial [Methanocorpusculum sp.]|nr:DUF432 domain-containing protein [Methanocorpusculum sp.]
MELPSILDFRKKDPGLCYAKSESVWETIAFGTYPFTRCINHRRLTLAFEDKNGIMHYRRGLDGKVFEANIASTNKEYSVHPAGPNHLPAPITDYLQVRFDEIELEPGCSTVLFVTAPLEIAITLNAPNNEIKVLDVFSFAKAKFALYGTPTRGVVVRDTRSKVSANPLPVKNYKEFLLRLNIVNTSGEWVSLGRVVLYLKGLSLYYDATSVAACADVTITNTTSAQVTCTDSALRNDMIKADPVFTDRKTAAFC